MPLHPTALTSAAYRPYGDVIAARDDVRPTTANLGTAQRFNHLAPLVNARPGDATPNLCVFRCQPMVRPGEAQFTVGLLERHAHSTQAFVPMQGAERYLVVVCLGGDAPDLTTLRAFFATGAQGITYKPGTWHHPLIAMDAPCDFACLVWENGGEGDCDVVTLAAPVAVQWLRPLVP